MARVFLITPFSPERAGNEDPSVFKRVQAVVREAAAKTDVVLVPPMEMSAAGFIVDQVKQELQRADLVIAILTGANPNVYLELGMANRPSILLVDEEKSVPFDVRHLRYLTYGGAGELDSLAERLAVSIKTTLSAALTQTWSDILAGARKQSARFWEHARGRPGGAAPYIPEIYVPRASAEEQLRAFIKSEATSSILVGISGCGLTNLLCHWMEERSEQGDCIVAYNCGPWTHRYIEEEVGLGFDANDRKALLSAFDRIASLARQQGRLFVVVFEHIDEFSGQDGPGGLLKQVDTLAEQAQEMGVRFLVSCPAPAWEQMKRLEVTDGLRMSLYFRPAVQADAVYLDRFSPEECERAYVAYKKFFRLSGELAELPVEVRERLRNPLMLRLLAETYEGRTEPIVHEAQVLRVFRRYYEQRVQRRDREFIEELAKAMLERKQSSLSLYDLRESERLAPALRDGPESSYDRCLRNGLLTETGEEPEARVTFTHLQVGGYALASSLIGRQTSTEKVIDFVVEQSRFTPIGWYAARVLLGDRRDAFVSLASSNDIELRELAIEGLIQLYAEKPAAALGLIKDLLRLDSREARRTALKAAYSIGPGAREVFLWVATSGSHGLRAAGIDALYLIWQTDGAGAEFTIGLLRELAGSVSGIRDVLALPRVMRFFVGLTVTIYINHCDREDVKQVSAALYAEFLKDKLHIDKVGVLPGFLVGAVAGAFAKPILDSLLLGDLAGDTFFQASEDDKACFRRVVQLLDPDTDLTAHASDLKELLTRDVPAMNIVGAMALAVHACRSFGTTEALLQGLFDETAGAGVARLWIVLSLAVLLPDTPACWTGTLEKLTARLVDEEPDLFHGRRSPLPPGLDVVLLPLCLAYAKRGDSMPYCERLIREGLERADRTRVQRCVAGLGAVGFYYPRAVFHTLRAAGVDVRATDLEDALVSALATMRSLHVDAVDTFLDNSGAGEGLRRRVAAHSATERARAYIGLLGFYNNAVHQALRYPRMRRGLLMRGLNLLAEARSRRAFVSQYAADALQMARDVDYDLLKWTETD